MDDRERPAAHRLGDLVDRRELEDPPDRGDLVGHRPDPVPPGVEHLGRPLPREEQRSRVDLRDRVEAELERGHDAEVAAAAAERPEELGLVVGVHAAERAVGGDELDRGDAVREQPVLAAVPAEPASEPIADDRDVRRRAVEDGEAHVGCTRDDLLPLDARAHATAQGDRVELDGVEPVGLEEDDVLQRLDRARVVAGPLRCDPKAVRRRIPDDLLDVADGRPGRRPPPAADRLPGCMPPGPRPTTGGPGRRPSPPGSRSGRRGRTASRRCSCQGSFGFVRVQAGMRRGTRAARPDEPAEQASEDAVCAAAHQTPSAVGAFGAAGS